MARTLKEEKGRQVTWSEVLIHAVQDGRCWDREVRRPAVGFLTRGTERSFSDCETNSQCLLMGSPASQRKPRRIWPTSEPAPEHGEEGQRERRAAKEARGSIPSRTNSGSSSPLGDGAQICFRFATSADRDARSTRCPQERAQVCQRGLQPHRNNSEACTARGAS